METHNPEFVSFMSRLCTIMNVALLSDSQERARFKMEDGSREIKEITVCDTKMCSFVLKIL